MKNEKTKQNKNNCPTLRDRQLKDPTINIADVSDGGILRSIVLLFNEKYILYCCLYPLNYVYRIT